MKFRIIAMILAALMLVSMLAACGGNESGSSAEFNGKLVFDHSMELKYAKCFSVDYYKGGYKLIKLVDDTEILVVPEGMSVPEEKPENAEHLARIRAYLEVNGAKA